MSNAQRATLTRESYQEFPYSAQKERTKISEFHDRAGKLVSMELKDSEAFSSLHMEWYYRGNKKKATVVRAIEQISILSPFFTGIHFLEHKVHKAKHCPS